jgi:regulator of RNase E activity RraA
LLAATWLGGLRWPWHYGSVDIFLEAMGTAKPGDILVIDNQGRMDEGCIGDLTTLEAQACGLAGIIVWGCHRDTRSWHRSAFRSSATAFARLVPSGLMGAIQTH